MLFGRFGYWEVLLLVGVVLLLFGPKRIIALVRGLRQGARRFWQELMGTTSDDAGLQEREPEALPSPRPERSQKVDG